MGRSVVHRIFSMTRVKFDFRARALWDQLRKKSELYRSDVLLMPHGDDFRYNAATEWKKQFDNLNKLIEYINSNKDMQMTVSVFVRDILVSWFSQVRINKIYNSKIVNILLSFSFNICFGCLKDPSHETVLLSTHNMFWVREKKISF